MSQVFFSFLTGLLYTGGMFFLCLLLVAGAKSLFSSRVKEKIITRTKKVKTPPPASPPEKPIKSIEINADEVDRIYVKKSS